MSLFNPFKAHIAATNNQGFVYASCQLQRSDGFI